MSRPRVKVNYDQLDALLQFKVTKAFCADYLGVSEDTIDRRIKEDHGMTFSQYHELKIERTALKLQKKIIEMGLGGNVASLIFALKNLAKWQDKVDVDIDATKSFALAYDPKSLRDVTPAPQRIEASESEGDDE